MLIFDVNLWAVLAGAAVSLILGNIWFGELFYSRLLKLHTLPTITLDKDGIRVMMLPLTVMAVFGSWATGIAALHLPLFGPNPSPLTQLLTGTLVAGVFTVAPMITTVFSTRINKRVLFVSLPYWAIARPMACAAVHVYWPSWLG